jgi:branched-chain amino acid transport system ATP-binding protein
MTPAHGQVLALDGVTKRFGTLAAVDGVSLSVAEGDRHALIGPNGAGKTTLFHLISGTLRASDGRITFSGKDVTTMQEHSRARLGIARTFQQGSLFDYLSCRDNVAVAVQRKLGIGHRAHLGRARYSGVADKVAELFATVGFSNEKADNPAGRLSHGERRRLELAVALATDPVLVMLDEPAAGMSQEERDRFLEMIRGLPEDITVLLVEHDMDVVFAIATRVSVLDAGRLLADGTPEEIRGSAAVEESYLGVERMDELFTTK